MFELVMLGTSASAPSIHRGLPSQLLLAGDQRFLIDCGEGTQRQILRSGVGFRNLNRVLLTHGHLDHMLGLGGLMSTLTSWENINEIEIWAGHHPLRRVHALLFGVVLDYERLPIDIRLRELKPGLLLDEKTFSVGAFPVRHRGGGNFGFVFQQKAHRPFLVERAEALGLPAGPERRELVQGRSVSLADGRTVTPDMVLGPALPGAKYVHVGDCGRIDNLGAYVRDATALVIEATFLHDDVETANAFGHLTAHQAALLAAENNVETLILTHVSRRYRERDIKREARAIFPTTLLARDFDHFEIYRDRPVTRVRPDKK
ncbi:MAG: MBL fold metallo-hydrolase [Anaerolineae bacterium]|nr:MBL fold metallo-hydrolase [Anaerolineae bacterium]